MKRAQILPFILIFFIQISQKAFSQCSSCTYTATTSGGSFNLNGNETLCITANVSNLNINMNGTGNTICVASGVTWVQDFLTLQGGVTVNVYGTLDNSQQSWSGVSVNGGTACTIDVKSGGAMTTSSGGFGNNLTINNSGTLNFTTTNNISVVGSFILNNAASGVVNAMSTPKFEIGNSATVHNYGTINLANCENAEGYLYVHNGSLLKVSREFYNHGAFIIEPTGDFQLPCETLSGAAGATVCSFRVGDKGAGKEFITNACVKVMNGNVTFDGPGTINAGFEIGAGYNLTINKPVTGTNGSFLVKGGTSTINIAGNFIGTNMKFYDVNTAGNDFDSKFGNDPTNYTVSSSAGCGIASCTAPTITSVSADIATCNAGVANNNAALHITGIAGMAKYAYGTNGTTGLYAVGATASTASSIDVTGLAAPSVSTIYTFRIWASDTTCYNDTTIVLNPTICAPCPKPIIYICGSNKPDDGPAFDHGIIAYLRAIGHTVTAAIPDGSGVLKNAETNVSLGLDNATIINNGVYQKVIVSHSAYFDITGNTNLRNTLKTTPKDLLMLTWAGLNDLEMAQSSGDNAAPNATGKGDIWIDNSSATILPTGLSAGSTPIYNDKDALGLDNYAKFVGWATDPGPSAIIGAYWNNPTSSNKIAYLGYQKGSTMLNGFTAPANRFFLGFIIEGASNNLPQINVSDSTNFFTAKGKQILDAALENTCPCITCTPPSVTNVSADTATCNNGITNNNAALHITGIANMAKYAYGTNGTTGLFAANATASTAASIDLTGLAAPSVSTTYTFRIWASDTTCYNDTTIVLNPSSCPCSKITMSPMPLPAGKIGVPYNVQIVATGGTSPYNYIWRAGTTGVLPDGLSISSTGLVSGTPTTSGTYEVKIIVGDNHACADSLDPAILTIVPCGDTFRICAGQTLTATAATGTTNVQWKKDGNDLVGETNLSLTISSVGVYTFTGNDANGCSGGLCCPIVVLDSTCCIIPTIASTTVDTATCTNGIANNNAKIAVRGITQMTKYVYGTNGTTGLYYANATTSTADSIKLINLAVPSVATTYTFRIYGIDSTCYNDTTVVLTPSVCPPCSIVATFTQNACQNKGTTAIATDDYFTVTVSAVSATNGGTNGKYEVLLNGTVLNAGGTAYGTSVTVGTTTTFKSDGTTTYQLKVRDLNIPTCETNIFTTSASASCSTIACKPQICLPVTVTRVN